MDVLLDGGIMTLEGSTFTKKILSRGSGAFKLLSLEVKVTLQFQCVMCRDQSIEDICWLQSIHKIRVSETSTFFSINIFRAFFSFIN